MGKMLPEDEFHDRALKLNNLRKRQIEKYGYFWYGKQRTYPLQTKDDVEKGPECIKARPGNAPDGSTELDTLVYLIPIAQKIAQRIERYKRYDAMIDTGNFAGSKYLTQQVQGMGKTLGKTPSPEEIKAVLRLKLAERWQDLINDINKFANIPDVLVVGQMHNENKNKNLKTAQNILGIPKYIRDGDIKKGEGTALMPEKLMEKRIPLYVPGSLYDADVAKQVVALSPGALNAVQFFCSLGLIRHDKKSYVIGNPSQVKTELEAHNAWINNEEEVIEIGGGTKGKKMTDSGEVELITSGRDTERGKGKKVMVPGKNIWHTHKINPLPTMEDIPEKYRTVLLKNVRIKNPDGSLNLDSAKQFE
jgi:hypothetical protein